MFEFELLTIVSQPLHRALLLSQCTYRWRTGDSSHDSVALSGGVVENGVSSHLT